MNHTLFLQSEVHDPYAIYAEMLAAHPVFHDDVNNLWAVYSYSGCQQLLNNTGVAIPPQNPAMLPLLNEFAAAILFNLVRLSNPPAHAELRQVTLLLRDAMRPPQIAGLLDNLIGTRSEIDWVKTVCKQLPALAVLESFGFAQRDIELLLPNVEPLTKLMLPNKTAQQIAEINSVAERVYPVVQQHLERSMAATESAVMKTACTANVIGLLIQSYDAGCGLLGNALLQALAHCSNKVEVDWQKLVIETLRFDPPIHNTRRLALEDIDIGGTLIKKGELLLLVLAAANRDPVKFDHPHQYDIDRCNNREHLTFGAGMHLCVANHFSVAVAADALRHLFARHTNVTLQEEQVAYEPLVNVRIPQRMLIALR
jgi:cytochrome P450